MIDVGADMTGMKDAAGKKYPSTNKYFIGMQKITHLKKNVKELVISTYASPL